MAFCIKRSSICPRDRVTRSAGRPRSRSALPRGNPVTFTAGAAAGATIIRGRLCGPRLPRILTKIRENELTVVVDVGRDLVALEKSSLEHREGQWILNQPLDRALERARTERRIVTLPREEMFGLRCELDA